MHQNIVLAVLRFWYGGVMSADNRHRALGAQAWAVPSSWNMFFINRRDTGTIKRRHCEHIQYISDLLVAFADLTSLI